MRRRYITSYKKLSSIRISLLKGAPIILLFVFVASLAKEKVEDTNIICFVAKNQWICAPEDEQQIASVKAKKLLEKKKSELATSDVVIKTINIPKFEDSSKVVNSEKPVANIPKPSISIPAVGNNPYAKLWSHQLIGVSTPQGAINYVTDKGLNKEDVLIIKSIRENMDWWIILYGLYKNKETGIINEVNLPHNIEKPWLRPLKNLKVNGFIEEF